MTPTTRPLIYVSGPMTKGNFIQNIRAGINTGNELRIMGYIPFIPHLSTLWELVANPCPGYEDMMDYDLELVKRCDLIYRMPGESPGADREVALARELGIPVLFSLEEAKSFYEGLNAPLPF